MNKIKNIDLRHSVYALAEGFYTKKDISEYIQGLSHVYMLVDPQGIKRYITNVSGKKLLLLYTTPEYVMPCRPINLTCYTKRKLEEFILSDEFCHDGVLFDFMMNMDFQNTGFATDKESITYLLKNGVNK